MIEFYKRVKNISKYTGIFESTTTYCGRKIEVIGYNYVLKWGFVSILPSTHKIITPKINDHVRAWVGPKLHMMGHVLIPISCTRILKKIKKN